MTVPYTVSIFHDVTADADGDIDVTVMGGYHGEDVDRTFTASELGTIVAHAEAHRAAYQAYIDRGYEDSGEYAEAMKEFKE